MESILKQVYGVELASQKVELASLNELQSLIKELDSNFKVIESMGSKLAASLSDAEKLKFIFKKEINNVLMISSKANEKIKEFDKKAKELGFDIKSIKEVSVLNLKRKDATEYLKFYNSIGNIPNI